MRSAMPAPVVVVEIAGRLVGDEDRRRRGQRAGNRDALLLAAGKLGGIVRQALAEPDLAEHVLRAGESVRPAGKLQRHRDVLQRRHRLDQVKRLEDEPDLAAAKAGERVLVEPGIVLPGHDDAPAVDPLQPGDHHEQRGLAGAGVARPARCSRRGRR